MKRNVFSLSRTARQPIVHIMAAALLLAATSALNAATIASWDFNPLPGGNGNYGPSPLAATTADPDVIVGGLTRGPGVATSGTAAARAWGGSGWDGNADAAAAISAGDYATFTVQAAADHTLSLSSLDPIQYRRSGTGPASGLLQYSTGGAFANITALDYSSTSSSGASLPAVDLSAISALQNVPSGTTVTFRIANFGASGSAGTWYLFDVGADAGTSDFSLNGSTASVSVPEPATVAMASLLAVAIGMVAPRRGRCGQVS
jgi:hypothetical protein